MMMRFWSSGALWAGAAVLVLATSGCSTKKYVTRTVAPIEARTTTLERTVTEHGQEITDLENGVSRATEAAATADKKAQDAASSAAKADGKAEQAQAEAARATALAKEGLNKANEVDRALTMQQNNMDNYTLVSTESVLFSLNSSELTDEAEAQLDSMMDNLSSAKHYAIQVQGFTDTTGSEQFNLQLSRQRAETVARYLAVKGKVPLYKIYTLGFGEEMPAASNSTREGREQNRRVEVGLLEASITERSTANASTGDGLTGGSQR